MGLPKSTLFKPDGSTKHRLGKLRQLGRSDFDLKFKSHYKDNHFSTKNCEKCTKNNFIFKVF